jgi:hypothetical protein
MTGRSNISRGRNWSTFCFRCPLRMMRYGTSHSPHVIYQTSMNIHTVTIRTIVNVYPIESDDRVLSNLHGMAAAMRASSPPPPIMARPRVRELSL